MFTKDVLILCLKIFFSRILDVSLGTLCTIFTVKGKSKTASLIGFVQIMIWFLAVRTAFNSDQGGILLALFMQADMLSVLMSEVCSQRNLSKELRPSRS